MDSAEVTEQSKTQIQRFLLIIGVLILLAAAITRGNSLYLVCPYLGLLCGAVVILRARSHARLLKNRIMLFLALPVLAVAAFVISVYSGLSMTGSRLQELVNTFDKPDLEKLGLESPDKDALLERFKSSDGEARATALRLLTRSQFRADIQVQDAIIRALADPDHEVRWTALWELSSHPIKNRGVTKLLLPHLESERASHKLKALQGLRYYAGEANSDLPVILPKLQTSFKDPHPWVRLSAAAVYACLNTEGDISDALAVLVQPLEALSPEPDDNLQSKKYFALEIMKELGARAAPASVALRRTAEHDETVYIRIQAATLLSNFKELH